MYVLLTDVHRDFGDLYDRRDRHWLRWGRDGDKSQHFSRVDGIPCSGKLHRPYLVRHMERRQTGRKFPTRVGIRVSDSICRPDLVD